MALLWSDTRGSDRYEVRSAGASIRLYRNGVNHSQWNPHRPLSGSIWDLITLPALHRPKGTVEDVLILGFGAGTVGRQLRDLAGAERIVGLDLDPVHLSIAKEYFDCAAGCELVSADAVEWVAQQTESGDGFDMIIDDLYGESDGEPLRYAPLDREWCESLAGLLKPGGMLVFNLVEPGKVPKLPPVVEPELQRCFPYVRVFHMDGYDNHVVVFSEAELDTDCCREQLRAIYAMYPRCRGVEKRYLSYVLR